MVRNFRRTVNRFITSLCISLFCLFVASNSLGDTGDVIDNFLYYSTACRGYVNAVWADVDKNGEYDTQVVFTTIDGHGYPTSEFTPPGKWYFFTYQACAGEPESRGRIAIHFVDILAPGFVVDDPATWTYKSIPALSIKASHDEHIRPGIPPEDAYGSIMAYRERFQNGLITGTETFFGLTWTQFYFSNPSRIMELYVTTDFAENNLDDLILYASVRNTPLGTDVEVDAGSGVTVTFDEVTGTGNTTATETTCSAVAPSGFRILPLGDPACYDVETTATYSGTIEVCVAYDDTGVVDESNLKLFVYEDPPGEWVDITTSIDTDNNIICGETDSLSQFAVMLEEVKPEIFDFNDATNQGWTLRGAYDENGNGPLSSNFIFGWKDYVNYPNPPGGDPSGDNNGSIQLFTTAGHGINNPGATWWIMQFHSPDLSSSITWQTAKGYSVQIAECMAVMTSVFANLYVKVYDIDQNKDRYFYSGTAQELQHDIYGDDIANWNHLIFDWSEISAFPTNYVVKEVFVNIWGKMSGYFEGGVYFDEVMPILGKPSTPDLDGDGDADGLDLATFASAFGSTSGDLNYNPGADFDNNGYVDESNLAVFAAKFGRTDCALPGVDHWVNAAQGSDSNPGTQDEPFKTISHALSAAGENKAIKVLPGTYDEGLGETFPLMLQAGQVLIGDENNKGDGATPTLIVGQGDFEAGSFHYATMVGAEGSRASGFKIGADTYTSSHFAIIVDGITMQISDNTFKESTYGGILLRNNGISTVEENVFDTNSYGVYIWHCQDGPTIRNNTFLSMSIPMDVLGSSTYALINGNTITGNGQCGIQVQRGHPLIENNTFNQSDGYSYGAIRCQFTQAEPTVRGNVFICNTAIRIDDGNPVLGTASEAGNNDFSSVSGVSLTHGGSATVYAIGNTWPNTPPEEGTDIVVNGTGSVVWGTGPEDHYP